MFLINFIFFDAAKNWQLCFQDPANIGMNSLIDLHHDIMFFLLIILGVVSYLLFIILNEHKASEFYFDTVPSNIVHNTTVEFLWTTLLSLILFVIAIPSFSLLYILEELKQPDFFLKAVDNQKYLTYEHYDIISFVAVDTMFDECCMRYPHDLSVTDSYPVEIDSLWNFTKAEDTNTSNNSSNNATGEEVTEKEKKLGEGNTKKDAKSDKQSATNNTPKQELESSTDKAKHKKTKDNSVITVICILFMLCKCLDFCVTFYAKCKKK